MKGFKKRSSLWIIFSLMFLFAAAWGIPQLLEKPPSTVAISSYSFAPDTPVKTPEGFIPIREIAPGQIVYYYNSDSQSWEETQVSRNTERSYSGEMIEIQTDKGSFKVSSDHIFPLLKGDRLEDRVFSLDDLPGELKMSELSWITAANLNRGDTLLTHNGEAEIKGLESTSVPMQILYSLALEEGYIFAVGPDGVAAGDRSLRLSEGDSSYSGGGCFPAGTPVQTPMGLRYIETLRRGDWVLTQSSEGSWELKQVTEFIRKDVYEDIVEFRINDDEWIIATGNHPLLVEEGVDLESRTVPVDIEEDPVDFFGGRWVEARELQEQDVLRTPGNDAVVQEVKIHKGNIRVYNLKVEDNRNYLVGQTSILAHNKGASESSEMMKSSEDFSSGIMEFSADDSLGPIEESPAPVTDRSRAGDSDTRSHGEAPQESGLKAGYADDNRQFNYFLGFLEEYSSANHFPLDVSERIILKLTDREGFSYPNGSVTIFDGSEELCRGKTHADGSFYFFPSQFAETIEAYRYEVSLNGQTIEGNFSRYQQREVEIILDNSRGESYPKSLDILFILDTTGSMGGEIQRLKDTIELIKMNLSTIRGIPRIRFGLVLYKDRGDSYITQTTPLTEDLQLFQADLDEVYADGGGDGPEDLQAALDSAMHRINWDSDAVRLAFVITDAPPHLDYQEDSVPYTDSMETAREKGVKIFTVGTGGLDINGEYVLRQISQYTGARYIFLTYGESGESSGGREGSVSHHTGENFSTDKLESIIIQFSREELSHLVPISLTGEDSYFSAIPVDWESREETLQKLFRQACQQLVDYSSIRLEPGVPTALTPFSLQEGVDPGRGELLEAQLQLSLSQDENLRQLFSLVERKDLQIIMEELKLQLTGIIDEDSTVQIGAFLGAEMIIAGEIFRLDNSYQVFLKLMRVETGEILSVTKAVIPAELVE